MKYLCLGPSGLGGFAITGFLKAIEHHLSDVEEISGCSSGAILGFLYIIHKSVTKVFDLLLEVNIKELTEYNIENFLCNYGFISHDKILKILRSYSTCTFKELYDKTKIKFHVAAYCLEKQMDVYFSVDTYPNLEVAEAICMSISIPVIISSYKFNDHHYIDGGTFETIPFSPFLSKNPNDVIIIKMSKSDLPSEFKIENLKDYLKIAIFTMISKTEITYTHIKNVHKVVIDDIDIFDFHGITYENKIALFLKGYHRALTHSGLAK